MIRDIRYIIKKVIIGIAIIIGVLFFKTKLGFAATIETFTIDGTQMVNSTYYWQQGNTARVFRLIGMGPETYDTNLYVNMLFCVNTQDNVMSGDAWSNANDTQSFTGWGTRNSIGINFTNVPCKLAGAGYDSKVVQVYGITRTGQDGGGDIYMTVRLSINQASSLSLLQYSISETPVELIMSQKDYDDAINNVTNAINTMNSSLTNKMNDMIAAMQEDFTTEGNDRDTKAIEDWLDDFSSDTYGLTSIITAPLNTITSLTSSTCSPLEVPIPFVENEYIILPCMSNIYSSTFGTAFTLYQTITTALIGYWCVVRIFAIVKGMKDPNDDKIEVVDL